MQKNLINNLKIMSNRHFIFVTGNIYERKKNYQYFFQFNGLIYVKPINKKTKKEIEMILQNLILIAMFHIRTDFRCCNFEVILVCFAVVLFANYLHI